MEGVLPVPNFTPELPRYIGMVLSAREMKDQQNPKSKQAESETKKQKQGTEKKNITAKKPPKKVKKQKRRKANAKKTPRCDRPHPNKIPQTTKEPKKREATRNKCHATSNKCLTSSNKKLLETSATLVVTTLWGCQVLEKLPEQIPEQVLKQVPSIPEKSQLDDE